MGIKEKCSLQTLVRTTETVMCDSEEELKSMDQTHKPTVAGFSAQKSNKSNRARTGVKRQVQEESQVRENT